MAQTTTPIIGIIGGTGLAEVLTDGRREAIETPFGQPSAPVLLGQWQGADVAFIARHGDGHVLQNLTNVGDHWKVFRQVSTFHVDRLSCVPEEPLDLCSNLRVARVGFEKRLMLVGWQIDHAVKEFFGFRSRVIRHASSLP